MWGLTTSDKMFLVLELRIGKFFIIAPYAWISGLELSCKFGLNLTTKSWKNIRFFEICTVCKLMFPCVSIDIWKSARTKFFKFALYHELAGSSNPVIWSKSDMDIFLLQKTQNTVLPPPIHPPIFPHTPYLRVPPLQKPWLSYGAIHKGRPQNLANFWPPPPPCLQNLAFNRQN